MEKITDALRLWRQLVERHVEHYPAHGDDEDRDVWVERARWFHQMVLKRWQQRDSSRDFVISQLKQHPGSTVLDIGAGTGAWSCLMAGHARSVTAVEPSEGMLTVMQENLAQQGIDNVAIVQDTWPEAEVEPHDFSLCAHALYGCADLERFMRRMQDRTRRMCFLLLRVPIPDGLMTEAAMHLWGQPYDSPNFQVAYNAMMQMGIYANVLMEDIGLWRPWTSASLDEALNKIKGKFGLTGPSEHDAFLTDLLRRRLVCEEGIYVWPRGVRSALIYWEV